MGSRTGKRVLAALAAGIMIISGGAFAIAANPSPDSYAFVARGDDSADALAASSLAGRLNAPIVLTAPSFLPDGGREALLDADPDHVIIAGGSVAVSPEVEAAIEDLLPDANVRRVFGLDRYRTAQELAALFPELAPAFLAIDGKANAAEQADHATNADTATNADHATAADHATDADHATMADDSAMFGGLTPTEYQHTWVEHPAEFGEIAVTEFADDQGMGQVVDPITFEVPVDGFLDANGFGVNFNEDAATDGVNDYDEYNGVFVLLDYTGNLADISSPDPAVQLAATLELYNALVVAVDGTTGEAILHLPGKKVTAGEHTVQALGIFAPTTGAPDTDSDGNPDLLGTGRVALRHLSVNVTSGITGPYADWTVPSTTAAATAARGQIDRLLGDE